MKLVRLIKPLKEIAMPNQYDFFVDYAPAFKPVFGLVKQIIEMSKVGQPTDKIFQICLEKMAEIYRSNVKNSEVRTFLNLPASAYCSGTFRRPFLEEALFVGLEQSLNCSVGVNCFNVDINEDVLHKNGFLFTEKSNISDLSEKIQNEIPQIDTLTIFGKNSIRNDIKFSLIYNFHLEV